MRSGRRDPEGRGILIYQALERAIAAAAADEPALIEAREAWNREAGQVHDDEPLYEERAAAFLEWYTLEHRRSGRAPVEQLAEESPPGSPEREALVALASSHRSLFRVREVHDDGLLLDDLWGGAAFRVRERRRLAGLEAGQLFDARLVADVESPPALLLTRTFCFHPREAEAGVTARIARARRDGEERAALLFRLLRLRVRCERYRHVSPARIYAVDETTL